jgi:hypothetical protein
MINLHRIILEVWIMDNEYYNKVNPWLISTELLYKRKIYPVNIIIR